MITIKIRSGTFKGDRWDFESMSDALRHILSLHDRGLTLAQWGTIGIYKHGKMVGKL